MYQGADTKEVIGGDMTTTLIDFIRLHMKDNVLPVSCKICGNICIGCKVCNCRISECSYLYTKMVYCSILKKSFLLIRNADAHGMILINV